MIQFLYKLISIQKNLNLMITKELKNFTHINYH